MLARAVDLWLVMHRTILQWNVISKSGWSEKEAYHPQHHICKREK